MTGRRARVTVLQEPGAPAATLLEKTLAASGFWEAIEERRAAKGGDSPFRVLIKPDLDSFDPASPAATAPVLVESLIDLLHGRGFAEVALGDGRNERDTFLHNREPLALPDLLGYRFETAAGHAYEILDLATAQAADHPGGGPAGRIARPWVEADFRICFAKNRTHETELFALCLHNLVGLATARDAEGRARRRDKAEICLEVLRRAPPHFCLLDASVSAQGGGGQRAPRAAATQAFFAGPDPLLVDWAAAARMGLDPQSGPLAGRMIRAVGLPEEEEIEGDLSPWPLWRNVHPTIAESARRSAASPALGPLFEAWFQEVDRTSFGFRDFYADRINAFLAPLMGQLDDNPRAFWTVVLVNHLLGWVGSLVESQKTLFSKASLERRVAGLELDPEAYAPADFAAIPGYLRRYERLLRDQPPNAEGLALRRAGDSFLFSGSHVFPLPYDDFVGRVEIARGIQYMNDYIGGSTVALAHDGEGRVVRQAERNLYLQQPNWMVLLGGEVIDVEKLELIAREEDSQIIYWRTVGSPNGSASHDDGKVGFRRRQDGLTEVTIFARQAFALPPLFHFFDVNRAPAFRDAIVESAYQRFFAGTMANLQAAYEGRDFRIGREAEPALLAEGGGTREIVRQLATGAAALAELLRHREDLAEAGAWLFRGGPAPATATAPQGELDADGFRHFSPAELPAKPGLEETAVAGFAALLRDAPDFMTGLAEAVRDDLDRIARGPDEGGAE